MHLDTADERNIAVEFAVIPKGNDGVSTKWAFTIALVHIQNLMAIQCGISPSLRKDGFGNKIHTCDPVGNAKFIAFFEKYGKKGVILWYVKICKT